MNDRAIHLDAPVLIGVILIASCRNDEPATRSQAELEVPVVNFDLDRRVGIAGVGNGLRNVKRPENY